MKQLLANILCHNYLVKIMQGAALCSFLNYGTGENGPSYRTCHFELKHSLREELDTWW